MFIPGETVSFRFTIPFYRSDVSKGYVTFFQDNRVILELQASSSNFKAVGSERKCYLDISLTQPQSLLFEGYTEYSVQLNIMLTDGSRCVSREIKSYNGKQFKPEVVT